MTSPPAHGDGRTIFLVDAWSAYRRSLRLFVEAAGYGVVGEADTVKAAAAAPAHLAAADVVILDPGRTWPDLLGDLATLRGAPSRAAIVLLAAEPLEQRVAAQALHHGVSAYLLKTAAPADVLSALAVALSGSFVVLPRHLLMPATAAGHAPIAAEPPRLTRREQEVLTLVAAGHSNRRIAEIMWVAEQSIRFHLANAIRKLGVRNRIGAIRAAEQYGLIEQPLWPEFPPDAA